jgi:hypothetical protein
MRIHDAAHAAIDSTGGSTTATLRNQVLGLHDPTLGSRTTSLGPAPTAGTPVGSASLAQAGTGGVPSVIQSAITNLGNNIQTGTLASILNQVLHGLNGGFSGNSAPSPSQEALMRAQTAQINSQMATQQRPIDIQNQINSLKTQNSNPTGIMSLALNVPGSYENSPQYQRDQQLTSLYGQQNFARQAASGWVNPVTY